MFYFGVSDTIKSPCYFKKLVYVTLTSTLLVNNTISEGV